MPQTSNLLVLAIPISALTAAVVAFYVFPRNKSKKAPSNGSKEEVRRENVNGALMQLDAYGDALRLLPRTFLTAPSASSAAGPTVSVQDQIQNQISSEGWLGKVMGSNTAQAMASTLLELALSPLDLLADSNPRGADVAEEKEKRAVENNMEGRRLAEAQANACKSLYYKSIQDEATKLKKVKERHRRQWTDPDFMQGDAAIYTNPQARHGALKEAVSGVVTNWLPPQLLCSKGRATGKTADGQMTWLWSEEEGASSPQGSSPTSAPSVAVTWYAATAVAAAVQHLPYISDQLVDTTYEQLGIYGVSLKGEGGWILVYVDSFLPCFRHPSTPATSRHRMLFGDGEATTKEIWTAVIEKAIAKVEGSYEALQGAGAVSVVLQRLLGCASSTMDVASLQEAPPSKTDSLFKSLRSSVSDPSTLLLACSKPSPTEGVDGIPAAQCLVVLGVVEEKGVRLVRMRRVSGRVTWAGDWSPDSELWNTEAGKAIAFKHETTSPTSFFISLKDFVARFASVECCRCKLSSSDLKRRTHLLSLFQEKPHLLKPGLTARQLTITAKVKADRVAAELLAEEEKKKKGKRKPRATR